MLKGYSLHHVALDSATRPSVLGFTFHRMNVVVIQQISAAQRRCRSGILDPSYCYEPYNVLTQRLATDLAHFYNFTNPSAPPVAS